MTQAIIDALRRYCESPPDDLVAHFAADRLPADSALSINFLPLAQAIEYTAGVQGHAVLGEPFGLIVLEDANNSDPYCYVTKGPVRGAVLHLRHDDDPVVAFSSLERFLAAIDQAIADGTWIEDLARGNVRDEIDRAAVAEHVARLVDDGLVEEICVLVPLLESDVPLMTALSQHPDFYVREAVAEHIALFPGTDLLPIVQALAVDRHSQVARPGRRALSAVNRAIWNP